MITKSIHESGNLVIACLSKVVTMPEIEEYFYWLVDNYGSGFEEGFSQLIYTSDLDNVDMHMNDIQRISHLRATVGRNSSGSKLAIVVPDLKYYWMAKLYQTLSKSSHINTRLFREVDDAFNWLNFKNHLTDV